MQVGDLAALMRTWELGPLDGIVSDVVAHLERLVDLGLGYLHLARETASLSGGEAQRVKMVRHLGSTLNDMLYVFDEPTTGLHPRDVHRLGEMLQALRDRGNTVVVVEHDPAIMAIADEIVEIGPGAAGDGGRLVFQGSFAELREADTPTGTALRRPTGRPREPRRPTGAGVIEHASTHNLQHATRARRRRRSAAAPPPPTAPRPSPWRPGSACSPPSPAWPARASRASSTGTCRRCSRTPCSSTSHPSAARAAPHPRPGPACSTRSAASSPGGPGSRRRASPRTPTAAAGPARAPASPSSTSASPTPS